MQPNRAIRILMTMPAEELPVAPASPLGASVGLFVKATKGGFVGAFEGDLVVGALLALVGTAVGVFVELTVGKNVGVFVGLVGRDVGDTVGPFVVGMRVVGAAVQNSYRRGSSQIRMSFPGLQEPSEHFVQCSSPPLLFQ